MLRNVELREYQKRALEKLQCVPSVGLFLKTGAGKTIVSLARFMNYNPTKHLLILCPQKIVTQWFEVINDKTDLKPIEYNINWSAKKKWDYIQKEIKSKGDDRLVIVLNFDIISKLDIEKYVNDDWTIIVDESHKIKNMGTSRSPVKVTQKVLELGKLTEYKIILTATPTEKEFGGYVDYYSQLTFLGYLDMSYQLFKNRYCREQKMQLPGMPFPIKKIIGYRMGLVEDEILPIIQNTCVFYAPSYGEYEPQHTKVIVPRCDNYPKLVQERAYKDISYDNVSAFRVGKRSIISGRVMGNDEYDTKHYYDDNTIKIDWIEEFLSNTDDIVSILYNYNIEKELIIDVCKKLKKKYIVINGDIKDKPAELKKDFDVLIGQYQAFGESLDGLQYKCHLMVFYSLPDSSNLYRQSLGRIDRVGQTEMPIYYHLLMKGTIDEAIQDMIDNKIEYSSKDLDELTI